MEGYKSQDFSFFHRSEKIVQYMGAKRNIFEGTKIGVLSQGSIINGCIAEDFPNEQVYGCIVTPRCALGHQGKVNTVHYIPVVPFKRWFDKIAIPIIRHKWENELRSKINNQFETNGLGKGIMNANLSYEDLCAIVDTISKVKEKNKIKESLDMYYSIDVNAFNRYISEGKGLVSGYLKELKENKLASYYLIESWDLVNMPNHFVIMLRDIRRLQKDVADKIRIGVSEIDLTPIDLCHNDLYVSPNNDNFFWVEAQIASPFVEHILQAFMHNFSQIGVEDIANDTVEQLLKTVIN